MLPSTPPTPSVSCSLNDASLALRPNEPETKQQKKAIGGRQKKRRWAAETVLYWSSRARAYRARANRLAPRENGGIEILIRLVGLLGPDFQHKKKLCLA